LAASLKAGMTIRRSEYGTKMDARLVLTLVATYEPGRRLRAGRTAV
jgi:hypothetical protein